MTYGPPYLPSPAPPPPAKGVPWKAIVLIGVVVALIGGGTAFAAVSHWGPFAKPGAAAPPGGQAGGGPGGLTVTGDAPPLVAPKPTFADGFKQVWASELGSGGVMAATDDVLVVYEFGDVAHPVGIDRASGKQWPIDGNWCLGPFAGKAFACREALGPEEYSDTIDWVEIATGKSLGTLDTSGLGPSVYYSVEYTNGLLVFAGRENPTGEAPVKAGYFTGPGKPKWVAEVSYNSGQEYTKTDERDGMLLWSAQDTPSYVFDEQTGAVVYRNDDYQSVTLFSGRVICVGGVIEQREVAVAGGEAATVKTCSGGDSWLLSFGNDAHPGEVVLQSSDYGITAVDPRDGAEKWASPSPFVNGNQRNPDAWPVARRAIWDGASTVYALSDTGRVWSFDVGTGRVNWWGSFAPSQDAEDMSPWLTLIDDSMLGLYVSGDQWSYYRTADGQLDAALTNLALRWPEAADGFLSGGSGERSVVLEPAFPQARASRLAAPAEMPACPSGMAAVSWTKYDTGSVLLCAGSGADYQVVISDTARPGLVASGLAFEPSGIAVTCTDGTVYRIGGGASIVIVDAGGASSVHAASQAWTPSSGQTSYRDPQSGIVPCPAGSWPISLSTWGGGWLLVCGTDSATPTWLGFADGVAQGSSTSVTATASGYCADTEAGRACANRAPALVVVTPSGGAARQHPVSDNYFPGAGAGGAGEGSGAYGVDAPKGTAADEARYLEQVLQASAKTRASLKTVLAHLNNNQASDADVAMLQSVVDGRGQLIDAIDGAPIANLPDGAALVAILREALSVSKQTDELYVVWAQQIQAKDWDAAHATIQRWRGPASKSEELKKQFVARWNANVAPTYGLSKFAASQI